MHPGLTVVRFPAWVEARPLALGMASWRLCARLLGEATYARRCQVQHWRELFRYSGTAEKYLHLP
eukprot:4017922-Pyramimonas_sp.AAC.1